MKERMLVVAGLFDVEAPLAAIKGEVSDGPSVGAHVPEEEEEEEADEPAAKTNVVGGKGTKKIKKPKAPKKAKKIKAAKAKVPLTSPAAKPKKGSLFQEKHPQVARAGTFKVVVAGMALAGLVGMATLAAKKRHHLASTSSFSGSGSSSSKAMQERISESLAIGLSSSVGLLQTGRGAARRNYSIVGSGVVEINRPQTFWPSLISYGIVEDDVVDYEESDAQKLLSEVKTDSSGVFATPIESAALQM